MVRSTPGGSSREPVTAPDRSGVNALGRGSGTAVRDAPAAEFSAGPARLSAQRRHAQRRGLLVAVLLMLVGAAGAVYLGSRADSRVDVVALARPVDRGQVVTAADLVTVRVSVDGGRVRLSTPASAPRDIIGKAALVDLPQGTLLSPELLSAATPPLDQATVGLRLPVEALPAASLRAGEWVRIVRADPATGKAKEVVAQAQVQSVTSAAELSESATSGDVVVYVAVPALVADDVAGAASVNGGVRLLGIRP